MSFELSHEQRLELIKLLRKSFNSAEFEDLLFEANFPAGDFSGTHNSKVRQAVTYAGRHLEDETLLRAIHELREGKIDLTPFGWPLDGAQGAADSSTGNQGAQAQVREQVNFANFDLRVGYGRDGRYPVEVLRSPVGETERPVMQEFPAADDLDFYDLVDYLKDLLATSSDAVDLGKQLRDLLFPSDVWSMFFASKHKVNNLRLRLRIDPPELGKLPWEYLYDSSSRGFVGLDSKTPLVRYAAQPSPVTTVQAPNPLRVLLAVAAPTDQAPLNVEKEMALIERALGWMGDRVEIDKAPYATIEQVRSKLQKNPHIFHFIGHGVVDNQGRGNLAFQNTSGTNSKTELVDADQMMALLRNSSVKIVVLNACKTAAHADRDALLGVAPALVRAEVPAVIAMQFNVPDKTAVGFARDLYGYIAAGYGLDEAVTQMRIGAYIDGNDKYFWGIPVLFLRAQDGTIFEYNPEMAALFAEARQQMIEAADEVDLQEELNNIIQMVKGFDDLDARDKDYILGDLDYVARELSQEEPALQRLERDLERTIDDIRRARSDSATDALVPAVQNLLEQAKKQLG